MYQFITSATEEISFVKEVFDGARNKISLPFLVVEQFFRVKVIPWMGRRSFAIAWYST
jgi:hypothetical protein